MYQGDEIMEKLNIRDANNYEFKMYATCMIRNCNKPAEWFIDDEIGLCDKCFKDLPNYNESSEKPNDTPKWKLRQIKNKNAEAYMS